jgi:hypothetical protein
VGFLSRPLRLALPDGLEAHLWPIRGETAHV